MVALVQLPTGIDTATFVRTTLFVKEGLTIPMPPGDGGALSATPADRSMAVAVEMSSFLTQ
jgi:hypothetical protein